MIVVPEAFSSERIRKSGDTGRHWIAALPHVIDRLRERWAVELTEEAPLYGDWGMVVLGYRRGEPCAMKVSWHEHSTLDEATALRAWNGRDAVRLLDASPADGALLLERLDRARSLEDLDLLSAAEIAGGLMRRLAIPAPPGLPLLTELAAQTASFVLRRQAAMASPLPHRWVHLAADLARDLAIAAGATLVHADLHYGNILAGTREPWLAIDPKAIAGDPELSVPELMWWRLDEAERTADVRTLLDVLVTAGDLDPEKAKAWTIVRAVEYWLWGLGAGLTEDPVRCQRLLETLV